MKTIIKQPLVKDAGLTGGKQRSYNEVVEFLDANWKTKAEPNLHNMKKLDQAFNSPSQKIQAVAVAGSNGKSLTIHYATRLLRAEGLAVGAFYSPHILTYNERLSINNETISNKTFTELGNEVINTAENLNIQANSFELLTMMALLHFTHNNVDVALFEAVEGGAFDATSICSPKIAAITRVTPDNTSQETVNTHINQMLGIVKQGTHVVCADQSKLNLQIMLELVQSKGGVWAMPIRKLAPLAYPFEQLHGRCAALAERIAYMFINEISHKNALVVTGTLLTKQKGQRGRPTIEAKRQSELNPQKTLEQFWKEEHSHLPAHFQVLDKEKPTILLDTASNLDAFKNLLLGIRLMHYQRPLKGLTLVIGSNNKELNTDEFLKLLRYFFKKTSGQVIVCPVNAQPGQQGDASWDIEKITNDIKSMKIKARSAKDFKEAFDAAQKSVDERHGLVIITGSPAMITEYWHYKGIKKI